MKGTADLCDEFGDQLRYPINVFADFGGKKHFFGPVSTVQCLEDNSKVKEAVAEEGRGRVLVINGGGSMQRAMVGDMVAKKAIQNGWAGMVVYGCIRDTSEIRTLPIGMKALASSPRKTEKHGVGVRDVPISIVGVTIAPGDMLVADEDGIVVGDISLFTTKTVSKL